MATYNDVPIVGHFVDLHDYPTTGELVLQIGNGTAIPLPIGPPGPAIVSVVAANGRYTFNLADGTSTDGGPVPAGTPGPASTVPGPPGPPGAGIGYDTDGVPYLV